MVTARANFCEGDSVTMDQIKKAIQRVLTRFSLNPYLCLGVEAAVEVGAAKKKYRKLILKYVAPRFTLHSRGAMLPAS